MFKDKVKELMSERKMSQRDLANIVKINESAMSRYISGERTPRIDIITKIARFFNISIDELMDNSSDDADFKELRCLVARNASKLSNDEIKELLSILSNNIK